jgi:hypothetical protein
MRASRRRPTASTPFPSAAAIGWARGWKRAPYFIVRDKSGMVGVKKNSNCCCGAGPKPSPARAKLLLSGEAGIGKSRLTAALLERLFGEPHTRLCYFCSPQHTDSALYPIIGQMEAMREVRERVPASYCLWTTT